MILEVNDDMQKAFNISGEFFLNIIDITKNINVRYQ